MCGFAGIFDPHSIFNTEEIVQYAADMGSELIHRGPDDNGIWHNDLISSYDLEDETFISKDIIRKIWLQHISGNYDWSHKIWTILTYISWRKINT